jgi:hypothetical protein
MFGVKPLMVAGPIPSGASMPAVADLPYKPTAEDLGETEDVQITQPIKSLAASLQNSPVKIYNHIRNNTIYIPSYGAMQSADTTLNTKRGNAFDIATLLVATLRAAGIPARYVYGSIQVPAERVMNWVGGVKTPAAALSLLNQGGIPSIGLTEGGQIKYIKMEHVWVQAFVDNTPSRGAVNKNPNTWIPMDASYKQYQQIQGMDIAKNVLFDTQTFVGQLKTSMTGNENEGWVKGIDQTLVQSALQNYQSRVSSYISNQNPNATVGDVLGTRKIIEQNYSVLLETLPYHKLAQAGVFDEIPDALRYKVKVSLYNSESDRALESPATSYSISLSKLANRRLGVTYQPASQTDADLIQSYKNSGATKLPAYLIQLTPKIRLDDAEVGAGSAVTMGSSQLYDVEMIDPQGLTTAVVPFAGTAGDETVFGFNGSGIAPAVIQSRLDKVDPNTAAEQLHQVAMVFWLEHDLFDELAATTHSVVRYRVPSVGLFSSPLTLTYFMGIPKSATYRGRQMDVRRNLQMIAGTSQQEVVAYGKEAGMTGSYLEGSVFDQVFHSQEGQSVSATKLLLDANAQGIPIYTVTGSNIASILPKLNVSQKVKDDVANAISAGKQAIVPGSEVQHERYTGTGYVLFDPETGSGAYLIDGGLNGAIISACADALAPVAGSIFLGVILTAILALTASALAAGASAIISASVASAAISAGVVAADLGLIVALGTGIIISGYQAAKTVGVAMAKSFSALSWCDCTGHYEACSRTELINKKTVHGTSVCGACNNICRIDGEWPLSLPTGDDCEYWNYRGI